MTFIEAIKDSDAQKQPKNSSGSFAKFDPVSFSWKTFLPLLPADLKLLRWTSLRSGMTCDGRLYRPKNLEPHISGKEFGYLPTPTAHEGGRNKSASSGAKIRPSLGMMAKKNLWPTPRANDAEKRGNAVGGQLSPMWVEWLMGYHIGWTELKDWAIQLCPKRQRKRL